VISIVDTLESVGYELLYKLMVINKNQELNALFGGSLTMSFNPGVTLPAYIPRNIPGGTGMTLLLYIHDLFVIKIKDSLEMPNQRQLEIWLEILLQLKLDI
jgi:hypothetical protein